jgi:hypothetical protein
MDGGGGDFMTKLCHNLPTTHPSHDNIPHHLAVKMAMGEIM